MERKKILSLRQGIQLWLTQADNLNDQNVKNCLKKLSCLKDKHASLKEWWKYNVIYLRNVQKVLVAAAGHMRMKTNETEQRDLANLLQSILDPYDNIDLGLFPNLGEITQSIRMCLSKPQPFQLHNIATLPNVLWNMVKELAGQSHAAKHLRNVQCRLEATMKDQSKAQEKGHAYLICLCVLQFFGFKINSSVFNYYLSVRDFYKMSDTLEKCFRKYSTTNGTTAKQAYILWLAALTTQRRLVTLQYIIDSMPDLCPDLRESFEKACTETNAFDYEMFMGYLSNFLPKEPVDLNLLLNSLGKEFPLKIEQEKRALPFLEYPTTMMTNSTAKLLEVLNMKQYYPQKLTYEKVIILTPDIFSDVIKTPTTLADLPWYFLRHIIGLDSDTREKCHIPSVPDDSSDEDSDDREDETISTIHPLDLIYIIFLCADDSLRQELADKMARCQYAVPIILPPPSNGESQLLHWGLRNVS